MRENPAIEIAIWTHIGHPYVKVSQFILDRMQEDARNQATGSYRVLWCTGEERILTINWRNVIMLESSAIPAGGDTARILLPDEPSEAIAWTGAAPP